MCVESATISAAVPSNFDARPEGSLDRQRPRFNGPKAGECP